jgi:methylmalonyl-CoA/ethylmalonyl-CoA epimerase
MTTASAPLLGSIGQIALNVKDLSRARDFYRDTLGVPFLFEAPPGLAFFQCGTVMLMLSTAESPEFDHPASTLYFDVADIQEAWSTLKGRGVHFRDEPHVIHRTADKALWMAFFDDSEGNLMALRQWK